MTTSDVREPRTLDALDPDLPFLAANAALELDNILNGSASSLSYIDKVARMLETSARPESVAGGRTRLMVDPVSSNVLSRALVASRQRNPRSLQDLADAVSALSAHMNQLRGSVPSKDRELVTVLRDFCVALSSYASSSRRTIYGKEPTHQYRK